MIVLRNKTTGKVHSFFVVDAHHHIGVDVDGHENTPVGPTGSYAFFKKLLNGDGVTMGFADDNASQPDLYSWEPVTQGASPTSFSPILSKFSKADGGLNKRYGFDQSIIVDQTVVFPMHDKYRFNDEIEYRSCNHFIKKWCTTYPHTFRLIGFGRVNPSTDIDAAKVEIKRFVQEDGLRGVKLHPSSDEFLVQSEQNQAILRTCAEMNIPAIFHTTYGSEVDKLHEAVNNIIYKMVQDKQEHLVPMLRIIIGHCVYKSEEVFKALSHPNIYAELSLINDPKGYLDLLREKVSIDRFFQETLPKLQKPLNKKEFWEKTFGPNISGTRWSHKIMFGTDHPYMPPGKYMELIKTLFKTETNLHHSDIHNILGANAIRIIPPPQYSRDRIVSSSSSFNPESASELFQSRKNFICLMPLSNPIPLSSVRINEAMLYYSEKGKEDVFVALHVDSGLKQINGDLRTFKDVVERFPNEELSPVNESLFSSSTVPLMMECYDKLAEIRLNS